MLAREVREFLGTAQVGAVMREKRQLQLCSADADWRANLGRKQNELSKRF